MAITQTALSAALGANDLTMTVASGTGFPTAGDSTPASYTVRIDDEYLVAVSQPVANTITVRGRGSNGTAAAAHGTLAKVSVSSAASDFGGIPVGSDVTLPPYREDQITLGVDKVFTSAEVAALARDTAYVIAKGSAIAITLVAPSKAQDGLTLVFTSLTDYTHAITATALLANAGASSPYTTATVANAKAGGGLTLKAENGLWNVIAATNWTLS